MKKNYKFFAFGLMAVAAVALSSCSNDEEYDVKGVNTNFVFVNQSPTNTTTCTVKHLGDGTEQGSIQAEFPVQIQKPLNKAVKVTGKIDNTLIAAYNEANGTNCVEVPAGIIEATLNVTIPAGEYAAEENITLAIDESNFAQLPEKEYLIPIQMTTSDAEVSELRGVAYVKINTSVVLIKSASNTALSGLTAINRTDWVVKYNGNVVTQLTDNANTYPAASLSEVEIIVDMGAEHNVIAGQTRFTGNYYGFMGGTVSVSKDGSEWTELGHYSHSGGSYSSWTLYKGVPARYVKIYSDKPRYASYGYPIRIRDFVLYE